MELMELLLSKILCLGIIFLDVCSHCFIFRNVLYRPYVMICNAECVIVCDVCVKFTDLSSSV